MWNQFRQLWTTSVVFQVATSIVAIGLAVLATTSVSSLVPNPVLPPRPIVKLEDMQSNATAGGSGLLPTVIQTGKTALRNCASGVQDAAQGACDAVFGPRKP